MPPIDPQQLLKALGPLLSETGGIRGAQEASRIASLMKDASKLVTRCIYLNILRATSSKEALEKFMEVGGWDTLNNWLEIARNDSNDPLLCEVLEVYLVMPVTVGLLKQNSAAKTIKNLTKAEKEKIKTLSSTLVDSWTKIIRDQNNGGNENEDDKKKKKKHKEKEREKEKEKDKNDKDKENDKKERDEKDKKRDKDSKHHRDREKDKDRDKDRKERHKDKEKDRDKDRSKRDKSKSSSDHKDPSSLKSQSSSSSSDLSLPSKSKDSSSSSKRSSSIDDLKPPTTTSLSSNSSAVTFGEALDMDPSKDDDARRRPKTVKQIVTKFRSTGLFDEEEDEESDPVKKKVDKPPVKRVSMETRMEESSEKKPRLHLAMPTLTPANIDGSSTTPPEVTHGRIKLIPPKRPPAHEIQESNVFMDALQKSTYSSGFRRKKKLVSPSTSAAPSLIRGPTTISPPPASSPPGATSPSPHIQGGEMGPTSPPLLSPTTVMAQKLPSVPSFYRDTLEDMPESSDNDKKEEEKDDESPPTLENMETEENQLGDGREREGFLDAVPDRSLDGELADSQSSGVTEKPKSKKAKKSVSWAREANLEEIFYFELDETERENVNRPKTFSEMKKEEMMLDRRAMETVKRFNNDTMVEVLHWKLPKLVDSVISLVEPGCNSVEKQVQMEREQIVLCALFFNKVPDTPNEPDPDLSIDKVDIKVIPLEDENGSCTEYEHTYNFNDPSSLPYDPEFGGLPLQNQAPPNTQGGGPPMGGGPMGNTIGNMNNMGNNRGLVNIPPPISHILNTLQQQAQETRDPIMQNLQGMLTNVLQNSNPQDSGMLVERILNALEPFKTQIPGLANLISSVTGHGGMDNNNMGGPRFMGPPNQMNNPRHGLLGSAPPGFNNMGAGNMRPNMQGPAPLLGNGGGMGGNPNFYMGGGSGGGNMRMGGPHWRGGNRRPYGKRGGRHNVVCQFFVKKGMCKYGDGCQFIHPGPNS